MTVLQRVRMTFGPLVVASLAGVLFGYLLNPSGVSGQGGGPPVQVGPAVKPGIAQRLADLEACVKELKEQNAAQDEIIANLLEEQIALSACVKELKEEVSLLWIALRECCHDEPPVKCDPNRKFEQGDPQDPCNDDNPCTFDYCADDGTCVHEPIPDCIPCDEPLTWYRDNDGDGYGVTDDTVKACEQPAGYSPRSGDCHDGDASVHPGAPEVVDDGMDNDCDGLVDEQ